MLFTHSTFEPLNVQWHIRPQRGLSKSPKSHYLARWTYRKTLARSCRSRFHPSQSLDITFTLPIFVLSPMVLALSFYFELFRWMWTWVWEGKALSGANSKSWLQSVHLMPVAWCSLKFYILAFLSMRTLCILGTHLGSLQSSVYSSTCSW